MKAKCKKCGDTVEVTRPREYKTCKCGAIGLDYGDGEYYFRVAGNPENFDGKIEDAPKIKELSNPNRYKVKSRQIGSLAKFNIKRRNTMIKSNQRIWKVEVIGETPLLIIKLKKKKLFMKELTEDEFELIGQAEEEFRND